MGWRFSARFIITGLELRGLKVNLRTSNVKTSKSKAHKLKPLRLKTLTQTLKQIKLSSRDILKDINLKSIKSCLIKLYITKH